LRVVAVVWDSAGAATKTISVLPTMIASPSSRRRRPRRRVPFTYEPLRDRPSSEIVHALPIRSSAACTRETSVSHGSGTSFSASRPMLSAAASSGTMCWRRSPSRKSRNGTARRWAAIRSASSLGDT
jgi:hypothetical protein